MLLSSSVRRNQTLLMHFGMPFLAINVCSTGGRTFILTSLAICFSLVYEIGFEVVSIEDAVRTNGCSYWDCR